VSAICATDNEQETASKKMVAIQCMIVIDGIWLVYLSFLRINL